MKFFKHFSDAHSGKSLQALKRKHGMAGIGRYWTLLELCASKMEKLRNEEITEAHCHFEFDKTFLMQALGYHNHTTLLSYLGDGSVIGLWLVDDESMIVRCCIPKLLECMDRDYRRTRPVRGSATPKELDIEEDIEIKKKVKKKNPVGKPPAPDVLEFDSVPQKLPEKTNGVIASYCDAWRLRYNSGSSPTIMPQHAKAVKTFVAQIGIKKATEMIEAYFKMPDTWFITKRHDIPTFMNNLNAITQFMETGAMVTKGQLKDLDEKMTDEFTPRKGIKQILEENEKIKKLNQGGENEP